MKMSSSASRDITNCRPSKQSSSPATQPSRVEPVSRRASRTITTTIRAPTTAEANRQPNGVHPEDLLAEPDQPLADLGVHDHARACPSTGPWRLPARILSFAPAT